MAVIAAVFAVIIVRLWQLQIIMGREYRRQAEEALRDDCPLPPARRGQILDRRGEFLAIDKPCHELCFDYRFLTNNKSWVRSRQRRIARSEGVSAKQARKIYTRRAENTWNRAVEFGGVSRDELDRTVSGIIRRMKAISRIVGTEIREQRQMHPVITALDDAAAAKLKAHLTEMVGATVRPGYFRYYPHGSLACHIVGVMGQVNADEQKRLNLSADQGDRLTRACSNYLDGDMIGKTGVEKMCESVLRPRRGYCKRKRRRGGFQVLDKIPGKRGGDVTLTLDYKLQKRLTELFLRETGRQNAQLGARTGDAPSNGAIIVLSVPEGEVLAMVSLPAYDLNRYRSDFTKLVEDEANLPLLNRAVTRLYPPGSTVKPIAALAGLGTQKRNRAITLRTRFTCEGRLRVGRDRFLHCWTHWRNMPGHGALNVSEAIKHSCNIFFYRVGARLGLEELSQWFVKFGFADIPGTGLPEEKRGSVPTAQWLKREMPNYRPARPFDAMQVAIGQGFLGATPLHVAGAMAAIARGGKLRAPLLIKAGFPAGDRRERDLGLATACVKAVTEGMHRVVNERGGTAYKIFHAPGVEPLDVDVYGKTGTATATPADLNGDGRIDAYEKKRNEIAWFAGFALRRRSDESDARRRGIAFAVVVEYVTGGGSRNAGPVARETIRIWRKTCLEK